MGLQRAHELPIKSLSNYYLCVCICWVIQRAWQCSLALHPICTCVCNCCKSCVYSSVELQWNLICAVNTMQKERYMFIVVWYRRRGNWAVGLGVERYSASATKYIMSDILCIQLFHKIPELSIHTLWETFCRPHNSPNNWTIYCR